MVWCLFKCAFKEEKNNKIHLQVRGPFSQANSRTLTVSVIKQSDKVKGGDVINLTPASKVLNVNFTARRLCNRASVLCSCKRGGRVKHMLDTATCSGLTGRVRLHPSHPPDTQPVSIHIQHLCFPECLLSGHGTLWSSALLHLRAHQRLLLCCSLWFKAFLYLFITFLPIPKRYVRCSSPEGNPCWGFSICQVLLQGRRDSYS